jgi:hypothetical protein
VGEGTEGGVEPSGSATSPGLLLRRLVPVRRSERAGTPDSATTDMTAADPDTAAPDTADPDTAAPAPDTPDTPDTNGHAPENGGTEDFGRAAGSTDVFTPDDGPDRWGPDDWGLDGLLVARVIAVASALVAVVCGVLVPFAPVVQNAPEIRWPVDVTRPEPTMLMLAAYAPESLSVRFSCRAARAAGATPDGYLLTTMSPTSGDFDDKALSVRVRADVVTVRSAGQDIVTERLPPGECSYDVAGDAARVTVSRDGRPLGQLAPRMGVGDPDEI